MEKPIFILGSHKSGTTLLRNLFDGVPELFVIELEVHFFPYVGYGVDYTLRYATPQNRDFDAVVEQIHQAVVRSNTKPEALRKHGASYLTGCWNVEAVIQYLREYGAEPFAQRDMRAFFDCYVEAVHVSLYGQSPTARRFVEKSVENAEFAAILKTLYPDAKFIHIVRNPYATLVSLRKFKTAGGRYPYLGSLLESLRNSYYYLYQNPLHVADYHILRYEDLLTDTEAHMRAIAAFVEIEYSPALLQPTTMGKPWSGNSMSGKDFSGISTQPISAWQKDVFPLETALVNLLFAHVLRDYDYAQQASPGQLYRPVRGEGLKTWLANRFLLRQTQALVRGEQNVI